MSNLIIFLTENSLGLVFGIAMLKRYFVIVVYVLALMAGGRAFGQISPQDMDKFQIMEDSMLVTIDSMYNAFIPDTHTFYCERFVKQLVRTLKIPNSFYYPFDKFKDKVNIMYPDDRSFRLFNWAIIPTLISERYYGAIQLPQAQLKLYPLFDCSEELGKGAEDSILSGGKWYGAIYYRIITHDVDGKNGYTLFGYNGSSPISNKKVLDVLMLADNGVTFGAPIFAVASESNPQQRINRFILEYKKGVQVSMNLDTEKQMIYFDKLVSQYNDPGRKYTYVPSGEYDGFKWYDKQWNYVRDLIPVQILKDGDAPGGTGKDEIQIQK